MGNVKRQSMLVGLILAAAITGSAQHFPPLDVDHPATSRTISATGGYTFCMNARENIALNSPIPLFTFDFAAPGASGKVTIDGKTVQTFRNERHLRIHAKVSAGDHRFVLKLDKDASMTLMSSNDDFKYCRS